VIGFTAGSPRLIVILTPRALKASSMDVGDGNVGDGPDCDGGGATLPSIEAAPRGGDGKCVAQWFLRQDWDMARPKIATQEASKYAKIRHYLRALCVYFGIRRVLLHEPGFHHLETTLKTEGVEATCLSGGDEVQEKELERKGSQVWCGDESHGFYQGLCLEI